MHLRLEVELLLEVGGELHCQVAGSAACAPRDVDEHGLELCHALDTLVNIRHTCAWSNSQNRRTTLHLSLSSIAGRGNLRFAQKERVEKDTRKSQKELTPQHKLTGWSLRREILERVERLAVHLSDALLDGGHGV